MSDDTQIPPERPWRALIASGQMPRLLLLCAGVWLHAADSLLVATLMPDAARELQGVRLMGWTIALYIVGSIMAGATGGMLARRFGIRLAMSGAALLFAFGCVISGVADSMWLVLAGRFVQGLGGGAMLALTFVGIEGLFPPRLTAAVMAVVSAVWGISAFCGPLIGGFFAHYGLWRWGFGAFAAQAVLLALLTLGQLPRGRRTDVSPGPTPVLRLSLLGAAIIAIASAGNITEPAVAVLSIAGGLAGLALFFRADQRSSAPLMQRRAADPRTVSGAGMIFMLTFAAGTISFTVFGPLMLQFRFGYSPLVGGYFVALESVAWTVAAIAVAQAGERAEPWLIRLGALCATVGVCGMMWALPQGSIWSIIPFAILLGAGFGGFWAFVLRRVVDDVPPEDKDRAASALPTIQLMGYAIGAALGGLFANLAGLDETPSPEVIRSAGFWIFAGFLPLLAIGWTVVPRLTARKAG